MTPPALRFTSLDDAKSYLGISGTTNDAFLQAQVAAAERMVERYTRRRFAPEPALVNGADTAPAVLKKFTTRNKPTVRIPDLRVVDQAAGGVIFYGRTLQEDTQYFLGYNAYGDSTAHGGTESGSGSQAEPATEITLGYGYGSGSSLTAQFSFVVPIGYRANDLSIWGRWGWWPTPPDVLDATYMMAARMYRERDAAYADVVATPDGGALQYFRQLPARVQSELATYRVPNLSLAL